MKLNNNLLLYPAGEFGGGSSWDDDDQDEVIDENDSDEDSSDEDDEDEDDEDEDDVKPGKGKSFDTNALVQGLVAGLSPVLKPKEERKQLSREELEAQLGKPRLSVDLIKALRDPERNETEVLTALQNHFNQLEEYVLKASGLAIEGRVSELNPKLEALTQANYQAQQKEYVNQVIRKFPKLKGRSKFVFAALEHLSKQGYKPVSATAGRRDVAKIAAAMLKEYDPSFTLKKKVEDPMKSRGGGFQKAGKQGGNKGPAWLNAFALPK